MSDAPELQIVDAVTIKQRVSWEMAIEAATEAFRALAMGRVTQPDPMSLERRAIDGEVHVKGAHVEGSPTFALKVATGFYRNVERGLPNGSGLVLVFDSQTGFPLALLQDGGYLTELRTGAAGAVAARALTPSKPLTVAMVGTGSQARFQLEGLSQVRKISGVRAWCPHPDRAVEYATDMDRVLGLHVHACDELEEAVRGADLVITVTPSREPLVRADWVEPAATILAVGADAPGKQELESALVARARVVTDRTEQCARLGELQHPVAEGSMTVDDVHAELGEILLGERPGREGDELIVCDLTGVGAQDAVIGSWAYRACAP